MSDDVTTHDPDEVRRWTQEDLQSKLVGRRVSVWLGDERWARHTNCAVFHAMYWLGGIQVVLGQPGTPEHCSIGLCSSDDIRTGVLIQTRPDVPAPVAASAR